MKRDEINRIVLVVSFTIIILAVLFLLFMISSHKPARQGAENGTMVSGTIPDGDTGDAVDTVSEATDGDVLEISQNEQQGSSDAAEADSTGAASAGSSDVTGTVQETAVASEGSDDPAQKRHRFFRIKAPVFVQAAAGEKITAEKAEKQLEEMRGYWETNNQEAMRELAHLPRFEAMSQALREGSSGSEGTGSFFYSGDRNGEGKPHGRGIAVYADNSYYYGDWMFGRREGQGAWFCYYPETDTNVVREHLYTGGWVDDLPDGQGQEHVDYAPERMEEGIVYLQNVIGHFSQGLYDDSPLYIMTADAEGNVTEWYGNCEEGVFVPLDKIDKAGHSPILWKREDPERVFAILPDCVGTYGVSGLMPGNN